MCWRKRAKDRGAPALCITVPVCAGAKSQLERNGGMFARRAPGALLLDYVPPEEPPSTPLGNTLRIR